MLTLGAGEITGEGGGSTKVVDPGVSRVSPHKVQKRAATETSAPQAGQKRFLTEGAVWELMRRIWEGDYLLNSEADFCKDLKKYEKKSRKRRD